MDNEVKGNGNQQDYGMRIYDPRVGKFLSVDPLTKEYPELTPYQFAGNTPIQATDLDGLEPAYHFEDAQGRLVMMPAGDNLKRTVPKEHLKFLPQASKPDLKLTSTVLDNIPVVGTIKGGIEGVVGYNLEGEELSTKERLLGFVPYIGKAKKTLGVFKAVDKVNDINKTANKSQKAVGNVDDVVAATEKSTKGALKKFPNNVNADDVLSQQLAGKGQLRNLRNNPNLKGVDIDDLLKKTPRQIEEMYKGSESGNKIIKQISKAFEGRDLGRGN